jgi:hypothetical protein
MVMNLVKTATRLGTLLFLGLILVIVVQAQEPTNEPVEEGIEGQGELGPSGLTTDPPAGWEVFYMFTGVYHKVADPEFATVVHCTNIGSSPVTIQVEFYRRIAGFSATAAAIVSPDNTQTFSTQSIASLPAEVSAGANVDVEHGSGRVLAPEGSQIICTAQVLALENTTDVPSDTVKLHLFDGDGNLIGNNPGNNDGIFLPIIFKNS